VSQRPESGCPQEPIAGALVVHAMRRGRAEIETDERNALQRNAALAGADCGHGTQSSKARFELTGPIERERIARSVADPSFRKAFRRIGRPPRRPYEISKKGG